MVIVWTDEEIKNNVADNSDGAAVMPEYSLLRKRLETFKPWKYNGYYKPEDMAEAGFIFCGINDNVQCHFCGVILYNWPDDVPQQSIPLDEHLAFSPNCEYAQLKRDNPNSLRQIWDIAAVQAVKSLFYSEHIIEKAYKQLNAQDILNPNAAILLTKVLELDAIECNSSIKENTDHNMYTGTVEKYEKRTTWNTKNTKHVQVDIKKKYKTKQLLVQLSSENKLLKEKNTCRLCPKRANVVFLPCGCISVCVDCTKKRKDCATCMTLIRGVVKTYLV